MRFSPRHSAQGQGLSPARLDCVLLVPSVALCTFCHFLHLSCSGGEVNPVGMSPGRSQPARAPGVSASIIVNEGREHTGESVRRCPQASGGPQVARRFPKQVWNAVSKGRTGCSVPRWQAGGRCHLALAAPKVKWPAQGSQPAQEWWPQPPDPRRPGKWGEVLLSLC